MSCSKNRGAIGFLQQQPVRVHRRFDTVEHPNDSVITLHEFVKGAGRGLGNGECPVASGTLRRYAGRTVDDGEVPMRRLLLVAGLTACLVCLGACGTSSSDSRDGQPADSTSAGLDLSVVDGRTSDGPPAETLDSAAELPGEDGLPLACDPGTLAEAGADFFVDISEISGMQVENYLTEITFKVPINDHSRLAFADLNGDGWDDIVAHSLYPNPQAGIPFEHVLFLNNGDGTFAHFSDESGLRHVQAGFFALGDVDNDGDQDCFAGLDIQLSGEHSRLFLNDGQGHFTEKLNSGVEQLPPAAGNAVFADFDGDADLDLFVGLGHTSFSGPDELLLNNGDGTFTRDSTRLAGNPAHPSNGSTTCDFDNDGDVDIFVSTYGVSINLGLNVLWQNDGTGHFTDVAVATGFASQPTGNYFLSTTEFGVAEEPGKGPGTFMGSNGFGLDCDDLNNDGYMDVFLTTISHPVNGDYSRKWSDPTQVLYNLGHDGQFAFENRFLEKGLPFNEGDVDGAVVDFDNDGLMDLSISRDNKYEKNYEGVDQKSWFGLMQQQADGTFASVGPQSGLNNLESAYTASLADCANDAGCPAGEACLFDHCRQPCSALGQCGAEHERCVWLWNANLGKVQSFCRPLLRMKKAQNHAWADIDHDGDLDLLAGGRDAGGGRPNFLFRNEIGHQNRYLALRLLGDGANVNRDSIGTRLEVRTGDQTLVREVQSSRGMYNSMDSRIQHFGLGRVGCDYVLAVRWPDGTTATFPAGSFPERSFLTLSYPDSLTW